MAEAWKQWEGLIVNGEFHLRQYLAGSEHSAVFLAEYGEREAQKVAIKFIPAEPANAERLLSRWRRAARLSHPHLIQLLQMGRCWLGDTALVYLVMENAEEDLSQVLPHRPLTPAEARDMLVAALDALAYLHSKEFVHGRLKPANIMAVGDQLKLSSDGLCRMGESKGSREKPGVYDAPEAAHGWISPAGDVWSLGMTLVEALTQRLPVWDRAEKGEPVVPETLPAPFLDVARHCLRRDPRRRWTVANIAARLHGTSAAPRERAIAPPQKAFAKRRFILRTVAAGLALAAVLAGPILFNRRHDAQRAPSITPEQPPIQPKVQPRAERRPATQETGESKPRSSEERQSSTGVAPSPTSLRSEAEARTPAGGLVHGQVLRRVLPEVSQKSRDTIRGIVRVSVRVRVDPSGSVAGATFDSSGPSRYFANLALQAARRWEFVPAKVAGRNVPSEWVLQFEFGRTATDVLPVETAP